MEADYMGTSLVEEDHRIMKELEQSIGQPIYEVSDRFNNPPNFESECKHVRILNLRGCKLKKLPDTIGYFEALEVLDVTDNLLKDLPVSIGNLTSLKSLFLSQNKLTTLPATFKKLKSLTRLYIDHNNISRFPDVGVAISLP